MATRLRLIHRSMIGIYRAAGLMRFCDSCRMVILVILQKLLSVGFGQYRPIAPNDTEENRAKNRRVEIIISEDFNDLSTTTGTDTVAQ